MPSDRKYTAESLEKAINKYLSDCDKNGVDPLIEDLMGYLGISPNTLADYAEPKTKQGEAINQVYLDNNKSKLTEREYRSCVDKIKTAEIVKKYSNVILGKLFRAGLSDPKKSALIIYLSKQKLYGGYTDRQIVEQSGDVSINLTIKGSSGKDLKR